MSEGGRWGSGEGGADYYKDVSNMMSVAAVSLGMRTEVWIKGD